MSERGGGFGAFLFGIVLGAVAGFVFAPTERGETTRKKMTKGLRNLKELADMFNGIEGMPRAQIEAKVKNALKWLLDKPQHNRIASQLELVGLNLKNLK